MDAVLRGRAESEQDDLCGSVGDGGSDADPVSCAGSAGEAIADVCVDRACALVGDGDVEGRAGRGRRCCAESAQGGQQRGFVAGLGASGVGFGLAGGLACHGGAVEGGLAGGLACRGGAVEGGLEDGCGGLGLGRQVGSVACDGEDVGSVDGGIFGGDAYLQGVVAGYERDLVSVLAGVGVWGIEYSCGGAGIGGCGAHGGEIEGECCGGLVVEGAGGEGSLESETGESQRPQRCVGCGRGVVGGGVLGECCGVVG